MTSNTQIEDRVIVWLDSNRDFSNEQNQNSISQFRSIINTVKTFDEFKTCINYLEQNRDKNIFLIISNDFVSQTSVFKDRCTAVYIFSNEKVDPLLKELRKQVRQLDTNCQPVTIVSENFNQLKPSFMYLQLLKESILKSDYDREKNIKELVEYCRPLYNDNINELQTISYFEKTYGKKFSTESSVWWYTRECFLYHKLNESLREMNVGGILKFGFYIKDLHEQLKELHSGSDFNKIPTVCYRGQGLFNDDFKELKTGNLISFDSFLSTSEKQDKAESFAKLHRTSTEKKAILFKIKLDKSITSVPFASIEHLTAVTDEKEILFSLSAVFRIGKIQHNSNIGLWEIELSLTSDRDPLLRRLMDHIRISLGNENELRKQGQLMIKMSQFNEALNIYQILLNRVDENDKKENAFLHNQLGFVYKQQGKLHEAFSEYQKALEISLTYMSTTDPRLSSIYSNIGGILKKQGHTNEALTYYENVLQIDLKAPNPNPLEIAIDYNNIGSVLDELGRYPEALKNYEEATRM